MKTDFSKTELFQYILKKENLTEKHIEFKDKERVIYEQICKVSWRAKTLKSAGFEWFNLSPTLIQDLINEYNNHNIDIETKEIVGKEKKDDRESKTIFGE